MKFLHDCLLIKDTLVIGDLHIGYDEQFHGKAIFPGMMIDNIKEKLDGVFDYLEKQKIKVKQVVLLGDVKHDFGKISDIEWRETLYFLDYLKVKVRVGKIVIIKGNHDTILEPIVKKRDILLKEYYKVVIDGVKYCFLHGDKMFEQCLDADWLVFGHVHPAITLADKYKHEKFKCFLVGKWKRKKVVVLPSFTNIRYGFNLNNVDDDEYYKDKFFVIPNKDLKKFKVVIYNVDEKREYGFGILKNLILD
tara:strand:- start:1186 stop:1932 length:747 start_codon:yes stop_codon:yes gene_type:complete